MESARRGGVEPGYTLIERHFYPKETKVRRMLDTAKFHYNQAMNDSGTDQKALFRIISQLMHQKLALLLPLHSSLVLRYWLVLCGDTWRVSC